MCALPLIVPMCPQGCGALWNLQYNNEANKATIGQSGGIDAVIFAMQHHISSPGVQVKGCGALLPEHSVEA
jgi:hypothetical protein